MLGGLTIYLAASNFLRVCAKNYVSLVTVDNVMAITMRLTFLAHLVHAAEQNRNYACRMPRFRGKLCISVFSFNTFDASKVG